MLTNFEPWIASACGRFRLIPNSSSRPTEKAMLRCSETVKPFHQPSNSLVNSTSYAIKIYYTYGIYRQGNSVRCPMSTATGLAEGHGFRACPERSRTDAVKPASKGRLRSALSAVEGPE